MRVRILGGGWYGAHLTRALLRRGCDAELHEISDQLFAGASGANPARLHDGFHYPRSEATRLACMAHRKQFMAQYGHLTRVIPTNIYAIAEKDSLLDFATYRRALADVECIELDDPGEYGICNVEGALLTQERHIVIREARQFFTEMLRGHVKFGASPVAHLDAAGFDWTIDCTFCANDAQNIDRFEPCMTVILSGRTDRAITIMDGPFPSLYPWDEKRRLCSLTSALWTPLAKMATHREATELLQVWREDLSKRAANAHEMYEQMAGYYPQLRSEYQLTTALLSIRAMPRSGSAARLVDVVQVGERALRVRAGKIDAVFEAERVVAEVLRLT